MYKMTKTGFKLKREKKKKDPKPTLIWAMADFLMIKCIW